MSGGFEDAGTYDWPDDPVEDADDYKCDKSSCYEDGVKDSYEDCCYGHFKNDQLLDFTVYLGDTDTDNVSQYTGDTNFYVLEATDPRLSGYSMPYIYDQFAWDHCIDEGYDIVSLMQSFFDASN